MDQEAEEDNRRHQAVLTYARIILNASMNAKQDTGNKLGGQTLGVYIYKDTKTGEYSTSPVFALDPRRISFPDPGAGISSPLDKPPHPGNRLLAWGDNRVITDYAIRQYDNRVDFSRNYQELADRLGGNVRVDVTNGLRNEVVGTHIYAP